MSFRVPLELQARMEAEADEMGLSVGEWARAIILQRLQGTQGPHRVGTSSNGAIWARYMDEPTITMHAPPGWLDQDTVIQRRGEWLGGTPEAVRADARHPLPVNRNSSGNEVAPTPANIPPQTVNGNWIRRGDDTFSFQRGTEHDAAWPVVGRPIDGAPYINDPVGGRHYLTQSDSDPTIWYVGSPTPTARRPLF